MVYAAFTFCISQRFSSSDTPWKDVGLIQFLRLERLKLGADCPVKLGADCPVKVVRISIFDCRLNNVSAAK